MVVPWLKKRVSSLNKFVKHCVPRSPSKDFQFMVYIKGSDKLCGKETGLILSNPALHRSL
jgi:hypothetical protein